MWIARKTLGVNLEHPVEPTSGSSRSAGAVRPAHIAGQHDAFCERV
jgi:hypothetical protein